MKLKTENIRKTIKNKAKEEPKGTLAKTLLFLLLITSLINYAIIYLSRYLGYQMDIIIYNTLLNLLSLIIVSPLFLNFINMFLKNSKDELFEFKELFIINKKSFKFLYFTLLIILGYYLITLILNLIPIIGYIINTILFIYLFPVFIIFPYIFLENNLPLKDLINKSFKIVNKNRTGFYGTLLSFTPWFLLGLLTLGVLYLWLIPYIYITLTYYYQNLKGETYTKTKSLSNQIIIVIFIIGYVILQITSFTIYPNSLNEFKNELGLSKLTNTKTLSYGSTKINYKVPKGYELVNETASIKTYTNKNNILQYTIYLTTEDKALKMDKEIVKNYKNDKDYQNVTEEEFTIKINNKNIKAYKYTTLKESVKTNTIVAYYSKDKFVITVTLTSNKSINKEDIKNLITLD